MHFKIPIVLLFIAVFLMLQFNGAFAQTLDWRQSYSNQMKQAQDALKSKNYDLALTYSQNCLGFLRALQPRPYVDESFVLSVMREIYTEDNQPEQAQKVLEEFIENEKNLTGGNLAMTKASVVRQRAEMSLKQGDIDSAIQLYQTAISLYKECSGSISERMLQCLQGLQSCYQKQNNIKQVIRLRKEITELEKIAETRHKKDYYKSFADAAAVQIRRYWLPSRSSVSYQVKAIFWLDVSGQISDVKIMTSGGTPERDQAALTAISQAYPLKLKKFPAAFFKTRVLPLQMTFDYELTPRGMPIQWSP